MAKIGILTFSNTLNYGATLQCFALSTYLKSLGHEVYVIDYRNQKIETGGKRRLSSLKNCKQFILYLLTKRNFYAREKIFDDFNRRYLSMTPTVQKENISDALADFDFVVVGSDQVWNGTLTENDDTYYLPFHNEKTGKISYAASFGRGIPNKEEWVKVSSYLKQFDAVSVREKKAEEAIRQETGLMCKVVCDPTFLLDSQSWKEIAKNGSSRDGEYVLCYILSQRDRVIKEGKRVAEQLGLPLVCIQTGSIHSTHGAEDITTAGPLDFLALFSKANYVVTDSFHGTCFSILFQRDFSSLLSSSEGANARIENLLDTLGLSDRYNTNKTESINYEQVNLRKEKMVSEAKSFLDLALRNN